MNKHLLSIVLLLTIILPTLVFANHQTILPGGCVRTDLNHEVPEKLPWIQVNREFIIETQIDDIQPPYDGWTLFKHDELELVDSQFIMDRSMFIRTGYQSWTFKASRPGVYRMSFVLNGEIKTVSVYAYIEWCGTEPRSQATHIIHF